MDITTNRSQETFRVEVEEECRGPKVKHNSSKLASASTSYLFNLPLDRQLHIPLG